MRKCILLVKIPLTNKLQRIYYDNKLWLACKVMSYRDSGTDPYSLVTNKKSDIWCLL